MLRNRSKTLIAIAAIVALIAGLGVLAAHLTTVAIPEAGGTYVEGVVGNPTYINPILGQYNPVDRDLQALIFSGLTTTDAQGVIIPDLAERWEISSDGLRYVFHLRQDARWHDGAPFSSTDVKFTIQAIQDPSFEGPPELSALWRSVQVDTPDPHTVVFTLSEPFGPFLEYTTQRLVPSHILATVSPEQLPTSQFNAEPIGTGPYKVVETTAHYTLLEANPAYYGARPSIARIQIMFYPDRASLLAAYERGEVTGIAPLLPEDLAQVRQDSRLNLYSAPYSGYTMVFLNLQRPFFEDALVRRALWQAIDRQGLIDSALNGQGIPIDGPILPNSWAYDRGLPRVQYDPEAAAKALEDAGWRDADGSGVRSRNGVKLEFTLLTNDDPVREKMIAEIAQQWAAIGVKVQTQTMDMVELVRDRLYPRDYDAILYGWDLPAADPDPYPLWHSSQASGDGQNYVGYQDAESDRLLEEARRISNREQRIALYQEFQRRFVEQAPSLILYQPIYNYGVDEQVKGVQITPLFGTGDRFRNVSDWYIATKRVTLGEATAVQEQRGAPPANGGE